MVMDRHAVDDEAALIETARLGDRGAFSKLVSRHERRVRAYVGGFLRDPAVVDDMAQEVFVAAYRGLASYDNTSAFSTWLIGIARHRVLRELRTRSTREAAHKQPLELMLAKGWIAAMESHESLLDRERDLRALEECLGLLAGGAADLVSAHYLEGKTTAEIARRSGRREAGLRMALLRIRRLLRRCVEQRLAGAGAT
jgi:RNA polymerase sigma-70 factor, ECF subfamily